MDALVEEAQVCNKRHHEGQEMGAGFLQEADLRLSQMNRELRIPEQGRQGWAVVCAI